MRIGALAAAVAAAAIVAGVLPAESGQRNNREDLQRRREQLRERQAELRRQRQEARRGPMVSEPFTAVARLGRQGTFNLTSGAGSVTITGSGGNDVRIEAVKRAWNRNDADARAALADIRIDVTERQGGVAVRTDLQPTRRVDVEVDFTIAVPSGASVTVRTAGGDVTVSGVRGELRAEAVGGSIKAASVGQVRMLRTLAGAISLENADGNDVTISTLGGAVNIRQLKARSADVRTVAGELVLADSEIERLIAQSLSGRVEVTGRLLPAGRYSLQSQSGDVRFTPIGSDDFEVEAATVAGRVQSDFAITVDDRRETTGPSGRGRVIGRGAGRSGPGRGSARILRGLSGDGGPLVTLRTFRGDITIARP
jgi:DUF4097 and DUF4098 domain-containing protein YvlB